MAKDIYFNETGNNSLYAKEKSPWNSEVFKEKLQQNGISFPKENLQSEKKPEQKPQKKKKSNKSRGLKAFLCIVLVAIIGLSAAFFIAFSAIFKNYTPSKLDANAYVSSGTLKSSVAVKNILLLGVDNADKDSNSRSDSMILLSIDTIHRKIKLTSFMRDMFVEVPGYGKTKLTHACQYGGAQLTADTIEKNFGIKIDDYAKIGYEFLSDIVDGIGGVTVAEIDEVEAAALKREGVNVEPGTNIHLDGFQSVQYCRIRKGQSDFQRTERQREMITLIIKKALTSNPFKLIEIASSSISNIDCTIPKTEFIPLLIRVLPCLVGEIEQLQIPADGEWWNDTVSGMAVLQIDLEANREAVKSFIYG